MLRVLEHEGVLWVRAQSVSRQALSKRLQTLPVAIFADLFEQVLGRLSEVGQSRGVPSQWQSVQQQFGAVWLADGSTLEAMVKQLDTLKGQASELGGKMMMVVESLFPSPGCGLV